MSEERTPGQLTRRQQCEQGREELLRHAIWNNWRKHGGPRRPFVDLPLVDHGSGSSSESDKDSLKTSSSGSRESGSTEGSDSSSENEWVLVASSSAVDSSHSDHRRWTDTSFSSGCSDCEKERVNTSGSQHWSNSDGSEPAAAGECPCCIASDCYISGSKEQSSMVAYFQDASKSRELLKEQLRERSRRCQEDRQQLLRTAIWNSWCAKTKLPSQEPRFDVSIPEPNLTDKSEICELPSLAHAEAPSACEDSFVVTSFSTSGSTSDEEDTSSGSSDRASYGSSDWSDDDDWVRAHSEDNGVEKLFNSRSSSDDPDYIPLRNTPYGSNDSDSEYDSSDGCDLRWSEYEESDETDECSLETLPFFLARRYYDGVENF